MKQKICDYTGFDYKSVYWEQADRRYEDLCDRHSLSALLRKIPTPPEHILDAGCGFGRLFDVYSGYGKTFFLLDYALNLLEQFKKDQNNHTFGLKKVALLNGNFYEIPIGPSKLELVISVRTLHHIDDPNAFFKEVNRILKLHSYFILEIPNKRHLLQIWRFLTRKTKENPFSKKPLYLNDTFINYDPGYIFELLKRNGLTPIRHLNTSFFRIGFLKRFFSPATLAKLDRLFQICFSFLNLAPSIYVLCENRGIAQSN